MTNRISDNIPYITAKQAADKWGISLRRVSKLCQDGRVPGAFKMTRIWLIPEDTEKPLDQRFNDNRNDEETVELSCAQS